VISKHTLFVHDFPMIIDSLLMLLNRSNRLKVLEARRPEEVGKTDNLNYCLYHWMLRHPTKSCYIFKDIL